MSTEYTTEPKLKFEDIYRLKGIEIREPKTQIANIHKAFYYNGTYIHALENNGYLELCRYGKNDIHKIFPLIIEQLNVKIIDYVGLEYPECLD